MPHFLEWVPHPPPPQDSASPWLCGFDVIQPKQHIEQCQTLQACIEAKHKGETGVVQHNTWNEHPQGPCHEDHALHNPKAHGLGFWLGDVTDIAEDGHETGDDATA